MGTFNMNGGGSLSPPAANRSRSLFFRGLSGDTEARIFKLYMFVHVLTTGCAMMLLAALPHVQHDPERFDALCTAAFVAIAVLLLNFALCQLLRFFFLLRCTRNACSVQHVDGKGWDLRALCPFSDRLSLVLPVVSLVAVIVESCFLSLVQSATFSPCRCSHFCLLARAV